MKPSARVRRRARPRRALPVRGITLDTGALIAFERSDRELLGHLKEALLAGRRITVPTVVVVEAWRGGARSARIAALIDTCIVDPLLEPLARRAGELLARVGGAAAVDAVVAASAAARGDVVLTPDADDLSALASNLAGVDVIAI